jgi:DNA (cytosine-5)-methyltransferase 1
MGYHRAGFDVVGVDIDPMPHYPFEFRQANALRLLEDYLEQGSDGGFDAIHASPPCQAFTRAQKLQGNEHPDLVAPTRARLELIGLPWVIENVVGSPLHDPILLCGSMFPGLRVYRHRLFESNVQLKAPRHPVHVAPLTKMGRPPCNGEFMHIVGNWSGVAAGKEAMGIDWMTRNEMSEAIPPAYAEHVGRQLLEAL